jgi:hypothetical protein
VPGRAPLLKCPAMALPKTFVVVGSQSKPSGWSIKSPEQFLHAGIGMTRERHGGDVLGTDDPKLTVTADTSSGQSGTSTSGSRWQSCEKGPTPVTGPNDEQPLPPRTAGGCALGRFSARERGRTIMVGTESVPGGQPGSVSEQLSCRLMTSPTRCSRQPARVACEGPPRPHACRGPNDVLHSISASLTAKPGHPLLERSPPRISSPKERRSNPASFPGPDNGISVLGATHSLSSASLI